MGVKVASSIGRSAVRTLREAFQGRITMPEDSGYDSARRVWNGSIDRHPAIIVTPAHTADVQAAVRFGRESDLLVAVRSGGHSVAGHSTCDGGLVIDLSGMKGIRVNPAGRRVHVQSGVLWGELDPETAALGLAVTGGLVSSTGVAGFTLGGGLGWLQRKHGLACDNLVSAEVVTAEGQIVTASNEANPELLWGLRGGGGNFGIVTSFEFQVHPVDEAVLSGARFYPAERAPEILGFFREYQAEGPEELTLGAVLRLAPPAPFLPESVHGRPVVALAGMYAGTKAEGVLRALDSLGPPIADLFVPRPYPQMQTLLDKGTEPGAQNYWKAEYLSGLPDEAITSLLEHLASITSPTSDIKLMQLGGKVAAVGEDDSAYAHRSAPLIVNINARWGDARDSGRHVAWTRSLWDAMQPWSAGGSYTNFMSEDEAGRVSGSYGSLKYERLAGLKRQYDPTNFFRLNHNVNPTGDPE